MKNRKTTANPDKIERLSKDQKEKLTTEAKAAKLKEILTRAARRSNEEADEAAEEQRVQDRLNATGEGGENDEEEKDLLEKIQRTYEKYLAK